MRINGIREELGLDTYSQNDTGKLKSIFYHGGDLATINQHITKISGFIAKLEHFIENSTDNQDNKRATDIKLKIEKVKENLVEEKQQIAKENEEKKQKIDLFLSTDKYKGAVVNTINHFNYDDSFSDAYHNILNNSWQILIERSPEIAGIQEEIKKQLKTDIILAGSLIINKDKKEVREEIENDPKEQPNIIKREIDAIKKRNQKIASGEKYNPNIASFEENFLTLISETEQLIFIYNQFDYKKKEDEKLIVAALIKENKELAIKNIVRFVRNHNNFEELMRRNNSIYKEAVSNSQVLFLNYDQENKDVKYEAAVEEVKDALTQACIEGIIKTRIREINIDIDTNPQIIAGYTQENKDGMMSVNQEAIKLDLLRIAPNQKVWGLDLTQQQEFQDSLNLHMGVLNSLAEAKCLENNGRIALQRLAST